MSELSPAAKAILVAEARSRCLREGRGCHPTDSDWNGCWICVHRKGVAAALRTAADQLDHPTSAHTLYAFADELEGIQYGTYRCELQAQ
jgi:hypothetical protein